MTQTGESLKEGYGAPVETALVFVTHHAGAGSVYLAMKTTQSSDLSIETAPGAKETPRETPDLSVQVMEALEKRPGDRVRVRRVSRNMYRCNWLEIDTSETRGGARFIETWRIRQSRFLKATRQNGKLLIEDFTLDAPSAN